MLAFKIDNTLTDGLKEYFKKAGVGQGTGVDLKAKKEVALQLLNWIMETSPYEQITPPQLHNTLRQSASVFVGNIMVKASGADANRNHSDNMNIITIGFDVAYAARMHEHLYPATKPDPWLKIVFQPGPQTISAGGGGKFVERHLIADGDMLIELYGEFLKKGTGA